MPIPTPLVSKSNASTFNSTVFQVLRPAFLGSLIALVQTTNLIIPIRFEPVV